MSCSIRIFFNFINFFNKIDRISSVTNKALNRILARNLLISENLPINKQHINRLPSSFRYKNQRKDLFLATAAEPMECVSQENAIGFLTHFVE